MKQGKQLEVRDADTNEYALIEEVAQAAYEEYAAVLPKPFWEVYWLHVLTTLKEKGPVERLVAVDISGIVGCVLLYPPLANAYSGVEVDTPVPEVRLLAVLPRVRGQGVGTALMKG